MELNGRPGEVGGEDAVSNKTPEKKSFVFGVDLDGVVADFYAGIRPIAAEWLGKHLNELTPCPTYGLPEWGLQGKYEELHRFAVNQRDFFTHVKPISQAPQVLRRLSGMGIRIRIITHRLYVSRSHVATVQQTVKWLDQHGIPYWDICFMKDKTAVGADLYIEDSPKNIEELRNDQKNNDQKNPCVIVFSNSTNKGYGEPRANDWAQVEKLVTENFQKWRKKHGL